jgi:hypothetical protein
MYIHAYIYIHIYIYINTSAVLNVASKNCEREQVEGTVLEKLINHPTALVLKE